MDAGGGTGTDADVGADVGAGGGTGKVTAAIPREAQSPASGATAGGGTDADMGRRAGMGKGAGADVGAGEGAGEVTAATPRDGCTVLTPLHLFVLGRDLPFRPCCDEHDLFYEQGGPASDRAFADRLFRECVHAAGYPASAWLCWAGVRLFGWLYWG